MNFFVLRVVGSSRNDEPFVEGGRALGKNCHLRKARSSLDIKENFLGANCRLDMSWEVGIQVTELEHL